MHEIARGVADAPIAEGIVAPMAAGLEEVALDAGHALGVEIALQLVGQTELPECHRRRAASRCSWAPGRWGVFSFVVARARSSHTPREGAVTRSSGDRCVRPADLPTCRPDARAPGRARP